MECHYFCNTLEGLVIGPICTDGAMRARWWRMASQRAGWDLAMLGGRRWALGLDGTLPGPDQSVPRAELFAVCEALRMAIKPCRILTDHKNIIIGIEGAEGITTVARFPKADLWRVFWMAGIIDITSNATRGSQTWLE